MSLELLTPILLAITIILLLIILYRQILRDHRQERDTLTQQNDLARLGNQLLDELDAQHDEAAKSLYDANQSLMTTDGRAHV